MSRSIVRGMSALAILLVGTSVATAFPIQNITRTSAPGGLGANIGVTVRGTVVGGSQSTSAGGFTTITRGFDQGNGYTGRELFTGSGMVEAPVGDTEATRRNNYTYRTFCMELTGTLQQNSDRTTRIEAIPPAGGLEAQNGTTYVTDSHLAAQRAAYVISFAARIGTVGATAAIEQAAIQLAIWEIMYEAGLNTAGSILGTAGDKFYVNSAGGNLGAAITRAQELLDNSVGKLGQGWSLRQSVQFDGTVNSPQGQDLITAVAVPEPSTFAVAGLSTLALLGLGLRRRKLARA